MSTDPLEGDLPHARGDDRVRAVGPPRRGPYSCVRRLNCCSDLGRWALLAGSLAAGGSRGPAGRAVEHYASFVVRLVAEAAGGALDLLDDAVVAHGSGVRDTEFGEPLDLRPPAFDPDRELAHAHQR